MKVFIPNRNHNQLSVQVENESGQAGLVFVAHGLSGSKEQVHIQTFRKTFVENDYVVVSWDASHTLGESEGDLAAATLTNYYQDMEDVIAWSEQQTWFQMPFVLIGHSLGGACSILYAHQHPDQVKALIPTSSFLSGSYYADILGEEKITTWQKTGFREEASVSKPGLIKRYNWGLMEDLQSYELMDLANSINIPTLILVGSEDTLTPASSQREFYDQLSTPHKQINLIAGATHTFRETNHLSEIEQLISNWIEKI